jgi:hypothetical protein
VFGVGSAGTRWAFLVEGRDYKDPLFLQEKEAHASVWGGSSATGHANHG